MHVARVAGLAGSKIATTGAGEHPRDLTQEEGAAYDVASVPSGSAPVQGTTYQAASDGFGERGVGELVFLIGARCAVSILLNAYDVSVPGRVERIG